MRTIVLGMLLSAVGLAHEGHSVPGSLPPAPHGGKVEEAKLQGGGFGKSELFFEVVFKDKQLKLYPLTLEGESSVFSPIQVKDLSGVNLTAEIPRKKISSKLSVTPDKEAIASNYDPGRAHRFLVKVAATYKGEQKHATLQVERK